MIFPNEKIQIPDSLRDGLREAMFSMHGGAIKFDEWLNRIADDMADKSNPSLAPIDVPTSLIPEQYQNIMRDPHNVVDQLISFISNMGIWEYQLKMNGEMVKIIDTTTGHIVEEVPNTEPSLKSISEKYDITIGE
jgi:hypothetical protein